MTGFTINLSLRIAGVALVILCGSGTALAKCETSKLVVHGASLTKALAVSAPDGSGRFNVWNGPRVRMNGKAVHLDPAHTRGNFIDWQRGPVAASPDDSLIFQIAFFCIYDQPSGPQEIYNVDYSFSAGIDGGYVRIPGRDDSRYLSNVSTIVHGVEGRWYHSTQEWESVIRPILENAIRN